MGRPWKTSEEELLTELYPNHSKQYIADRIDRPVAAIKRRAQELGITEKPKSGLTITPPPVDTSDLPRREIVFKPLKKRPLAPFAEDRMAQMAAIPSYKPKAMQL